MVRTGTFPIRKFLSTLDATKFMTVSCHRSFRPYEVSTKPRSILLLDVERGVVQQVRKDTSANNSAVGSQGS